MVLLNLVSAFELIYCAYLVVFFHLFVLLHLEIIHRARRNEILDLILWQIYFPKV